MSTIECGMDSKRTSVPAIAPASAGMTALTRLKFAWRAIRNRIAANVLSDFDDRMLDDIGLSRRDVVVALDRSGVLDDPSRLLAGAARERARTRFVRSARR